MWGFCVYKLILSTINSIDSKQILSTFPEESQTSKHFRVKAEKQILKEFPINYLEDSNSEYWRNLSKYAISLRFIRFFIFWFLNTPECSISSFNLCYQRHIQLPFCVCWHPLPFYQETWFSLFDLSRFGLILQFIPVYIRELVFFFLLLWLYLVYQGCSEASPWRWLVPERWQISYWLRIGLLVLDRCILQHFALLLAIVCWLLGNLANLRAIGKWAQHTSCFSWNWIKSQQFSWKKWAPSRIGASCLLFLDWSSSK